MTTRTASPVGDKIEYAHATNAIKAAHPTLSLTYIGTDGAMHYFQQWGEALAYTVPVSKGWKAHS